MVIILIISIILFCLWCMLRISSICSREEEKLHKYFDTFYHKLDTLLYQLEPALQKDIKNFFFFF